MVLSDKLFPHDISAEESVIGSLLLDGMSFTKIASFLEPEHFYLEPNKIIFEIARDLMVENQLRPNKINNTDIIDLFRNIKKENFLFDYNYRH